MHLYADNPAKRNELHQLLLQLLPATGTYEDYRMLQKEYFINKPDEWQKWKIKILTQLTVLMRDRIDSAKFLFAIYQDENKYDKIADKLQESATIELALDYFDILFQFSKQKFLKSLCYFSSIYKYQEYNTQFYPLLADKVREHYTKKEITLALADSKSYYLGTFSRYVEKMLQA
jgi:hypothetical protein